MLKINRLSRLLVVIALLSTHLMFAVDDSYACSCVYDPELTEEERLLQNLERDFNKVVFVGTVLEKTDENADAEVVSSADPLAIRFEVESVYKGEAEEILTVTTARSGASCGYLFNEGQRYLVFASSDLSSGLCSGNIDSPSAEILAVLGPGHSPDSGTDTGRGSTWLWVIIGAGSVLVVAGLYAKKRKTNSKNIA